MRGGLPGATLCSPPKKCPGSVSAPRPTTLEGIVVMGKADV